MKAVLEQIISPANSSFSVFNFSSPRFQCPYHYHPEIELTLIQAGRGQRLIGDHLAPFEAGDLVLLGSGLPHTYFHPPGFDEGPDAARSLVVQFHPDLAGSFFSKAPECLKILRLAERSSRGLVPGESTKSQVIHKMLQLPGAPELKRLILLLEVLDLLASDTQGTPLASPGFHPEFNRHQAGRIEQVCEWITRNFQDSITLEQAARKAHLTPPAFSRFFHRATNRTFIHFLNELRIGHACRLLLETERSIAEIAFASGFENLSNFNRRFRELKKSTPRDYRSSAKKRED